MKWFNQQDLKDVNTLRAAYKRLLIKYHPDNNTQDTTGIMQEINAEYSRKFMMRVLIEMLVKIKQKIRCGIGAEEGNSSVSSSYVLDRKKVPL